LDLGVDGSNDRNDSSKLESAATKGGIEGRSAVIEAIEVIEEPQKESWCGAMHMWRQCRTLQWPCSLVDDTGIIR
jgi:hypothetical protein